MTTCTICGEQVYGPEGFENIVCEPCRALNLAGNPTDSIPASEPVRDPATTSLLLQAVQREHERSVAFAAWVERHVNLPVPLPYIPYAPRHLAQAEASVAEARERLTSC